MYKHKQNQWLYHKWLLVCALMSLSGLAKATGLQLMLQNVTNLGTGYAGTASLAEDASTNYYNPAGLTRLGREQIVVGGILSVPHTTLNVTNAVSTFGVPLSPSTGSTRPSNNVLIPLFHYAKRINERWMFGFSAVSPFGSKTNYKDNSIARYMNTRSSLKTVDLGPSLGYKFDGGLSVGAGVDAVYVIAKLDSSVGSGNLQTDGFSNNNATGWGLGYNVGGLYEIDHCTRFGVQYRSKVSVKPKGESLVQLATGLPVSQQGARTEIALPESVVISAYHALNDCWAIMADVGWTRASRFENLIITLDNGSRLIYTENYKNSYRIAGGGTYQYDEQWQLKLGIMFDTAPTQAQTRNIYIPDQDQIIPTFGAKYKISKNLALDFGYAHVFYKKINNINQPAPLSVGLTQGTQSIQGSMRNRIDAIGFQLTWDIKPE